MVRRPAVSYAENRFKGKRVVACEVGVLRGWNAIDIIHAMKVAKLYLVDQYDENWMPGTHYTGKMGGYKDEARRNTDKYDCAVWLYLDGESAANIIPDMLDFVYIDADRSYEGVRRMIRAYWNILKIGGVLSGPGYEDAWPGLVRAVDEFAIEIGKVVKWGANLENAKHRDWWIVKE